VIALNGVLFFQFGMLTSILVSQSPLVLGTINALLPVNSKSAHAPDSLAEDKEMQMLSNNTDSIKDNPLIPLL